MASETVPAATPGPNDPAPTAPTPTGLAGILAPVQPARTGTTAAFTLDPATSTEVGQETVGSGASSAAYHTTSTDPENPTSARSSGSSGGAGAGKEGVFKTILRAAAERWRKGADIHVKRLEMQKARYQAAQVKETRQVVVNRTPGNTSGGRSGSGMGGKQTSGKTNASGMGGGQSKNSSGGPQSSGKSSGSRVPAGAGGGRHTSGSTGKDSTGKDRTGGSGSGGRSTRSGSGSGTGSSGSGAGASRGSDGSKRSTTGTGTNDTAGAGRSNTSGTGKTDSKNSGSGSSGKPGSDGKQGKDGRPGKSTDSATKTPGGSTSRDERPWKQDRHHDKTPTNGTPKNTPGTPGTVDVTKDTKGSKTGKDTGQGAGTSTGRGTKAADGPKKPGPPLDVQPSREAGYRDGTSAGRIIAHMGAYRDGVRDGYHDTQEAAKRERDRLDQAHADRKKQRTTEPKDPDVSAKTSADHHPQPLPVAQVTASHVVLDNGQSHTRGEIRTLKQYERRLEQKAMAMHRVADATKKLQAHAEEQAKKANTLLEQAKAIKGGEKVTGILTRLHDKAANQARIAQNVNRRAAKAAENAAVVLANVRTRYGSIYQAVVDSPETKPAELRFYRDGGTNHG